MDSEISKSIQGLTTAEDMRNHTKIIMQPYANWEEYLTPAPLSIALLGELVFISSATDFSVNKNPPKDGYTFIKYPESFRACLMQVCNSGWWAFLEAHKSMDQIRLHTSQVPDYMNAAARILFQDDNEVVNTFLPDQLNNIIVVAEECVKLSEGAVKHFTDVINIIQELLEACINAQSFYGEELEAMKKKIQESKLRMQSALESKKIFEKTMSAVEKQMDRAHEDYKKAMDSLPSGWEMVGMDVVSGLTQSITGLLNGLATAISQPAQFLGKIKMIDAINVYSKSATILNCVLTFLNFMNVKSEGNHIDWTNLYDQKNKTTKTDFIAKQFEGLNEIFKETPDSDAKTQAQGISNKGLEICTELAKYAPEGKLDKDKSTQIIQMVSNLIKSARSFDSKSKEVTNSPAIFQKPPMMFKEEQKLERPTASQRASDNARFSIEQTRAQLDKTREDYNKCMENLEKNRKELIDILVTMRNCELKEIDFKTTIAMLTKGLDAMGRVKEQWEKMVLLFQMVSNIVKISLSTTLKNFVSTSENTSQLLSYSGKLFSKDMLYFQVFQASNLANLVYIISGTYTDVSSKYLMGRVSSLGKLMAMDKTKPEFETERIELQKGCDEAQGEILKLVLKNKQEYEQKSTARLERIERELLAILPAAPPEKIKSIQEDVKAGFSEYV